jgi:chorismate synthase
LGGIFEVIADGVPIGLGSHVQWDKKLDGRLAQAVMSIPAVKGVEIGRAFELAQKFGSQVHDPFLAPNPNAPDWRFFPRASNNAGGLEGGVTNGERIVVRGAMKPISTLRNPLPSVDLRTLQPARAHVERSDVCAVPAAAVVAEAMVALVIADAVLEKFGGDSMEELKANINRFRELVRSWMTGGEPDACPEKNQAPNRKPVFLSTKLRRRKKVWRGIFWFALLSLAALPSVHWANRLLYQKQLQTVEPFLQPLPLTKRGEGRGARDGKLWERVVIVSPHPDDETLGCAGLIQSLLQRGLMPFVLVFTNGDGFDASIHLKLYEVKIKPEDRAAYSRMRMLETLEAMAKLGLSSQQVIFLGFSERTLAEDWLWKAMKNLSRFWLNIWSEFSRQL